MNCQRSMICRRCGSTMTFKKFFDYGGHFWGWECIFCREIVDQAPEIPQPPGEGWIEREKLTGRNGWG